MATDLTDEEIAAIQPLRVWGAFVALKKENAALRLAARTLLVVLGDDRVSRSEAARNLDALLREEG